MPRSAKKRGAHASSSSDPLAKPCHGHKLGYERDIEAARTANCVQKFLEHVSGAGGLFLDSSNTMRAHDPAVAVEIMQLTTLMVMLNPVTS